MVCEQRTSNFVLSTPIGNLALVMCREGLHSSRLIPTDDEFSPDQMIHVDFATEDKSYLYRNILRRIKGFYSQYFCSYYRMEDDVKYGPPLPLCLNSIGNDYFTGVWMKLYQTVHAGTTIKFENLTSLLRRQGPEGSDEDVMRALAANVYEIIIPCHRVVPVDGEIGEYMPGKKKMTEWLLKYEGYGCSEVNDEDHSFPCDNCISMDIGSEKVQIRIPCDFYNEPFMI